MEINSLTTKWKKMKPITKHIQEDSDDEDYSKIGDNLEDESNNNSERNLESERKLRATVPNFNKTCLENQCHKLAASTYYPINASVDKVLSHASLGILNSFIK